VKLSNYARKVGVHYQYLGKLNANPPAGCRIDAKIGLERVLHNIIKDLREGDQRKFPSTDYRTALR